jgi:TPR repeat protein
LDEAVRALNLGQRERAVTAWLQVILLEPEGSPDNRFASAMLAMFGLNQMERALGLLRNAADLGHEMAMFWLGNLAFFEADLVDDAKYWWEAAAAAGDPSAMFNLGGLAYRCGDVDEARRWWLAAEDAGAVEAKTGLAVLAANEGAKATARKTWLEVVAEYPSAEALFNLGVLDSEADDRDGALHWWTLAAGLGSVPARERLALDTAQLRARVVPPTAGQ